MDVESEIAAWRAEIAAKSHLATEDLGELEDHLRDEMEALRAAGLAEDEALLIAVRRMGSSTVLAGELAMANLDRTWVQLPRAEEPGGGGYRREAGWVVLAAATAAALGKLPLLFGVQMAEGIDVYAGIWHSSLSRS